MDNSGTTLWLTVLYCLGAVVTLLLALFRSAPKARWVFEKLKKLLFFAMLIRLALEFSLEWSLSAFLNTQQLFYMNTGEGAASLLTFIYIACLVSAIPVFFLLGWLFYQKKGISSCSEVVQDIKVSTLGSSVFNGLFITRRFAFSFVLVFC